MLLRNALAYLFAQGIPAAVSFAALAIYSRLLVPEEYGRYALAIAGLSLAGVVVFQWQRVVVARWLPARAGDRAFLGEVLCVFARLALGASLAGVLIVWFWPDPASRGVAALAVPLLIALSWLELNLVIASAQAAPGRYGRLQGARAVVSLPVGAGLASIGVGAAAPMCGLLLGALCAALLFGRGPWAGVRLESPDRKELGRQLEYGLPLVATFALGWVISGSDRLLIGWLLGPPAAGQYAVGSDLAQYSLGLLLGAVNTAAYPLAVRAFESGGRAAAAAQLRRNSELVFALALSAAAGLAALTPEIVDAVVGSGFREAAQVMPWIAFAAAAGAIKAFHFDAAFHLSRNSRGLVASSGLATLLNLALNIALIPLFGIVGAAFASLSAMTLGAIASAWLGRRLFPMPPFLPAFARGLVMAAGAAAGARFGGASIEGWPGLLGGLAGGTACAVAGALLLDIAGTRRAALAWARKIIVAP
ncbi:MAG TPA: oligosaccharide flippase family protein [Burkholderiales bacterium]